MRMRRSRGTAMRLRGSLSFAALLIATAADAQSQGSVAPATPQTRSGTPSQQEVMVTAQRRPQRNKDVPISVSRLNAEAVQTIQAAGGDIRSLASRVPSLNIESSFGRTFPRLYIRGLGNPDFDITAAQPVGVYYDDVVLENPLLKSFPIFDIDDVEVLAGPQGTLFGRNTPAGVLKVSSMHPTDEFGGYFDQSWASYNTITTTGVVNAPVIPGKLDVRISIINQHRDDWVSNDYTGGYTWRKNLEGYNDIAGRFQAMYHFDDSFSLLFEADVRHLEGTATLFRANIIQKGSNGLVAGFDPAQAAIDGDNYQNVNTRGGHVTLHKDLPGGYGVDFISAYEHAAIKSRGDIDGGFLPEVPFDVETATITPAVDQFTEELRLSANNWGRLFNQAGVYYFHEYIDNYDQDFTPVGQLTTQANERQSTESVGLFDSASYRLTDRLKIQAGVRYTSDFRTYDATRQFGGDGYLQLTTKANAANVSWDASATYALTSGINAYFRAATGYLEPSVQGRITDENYLSKAGSETTTSYEIGLKGAAFRRRAIFTIDAFMWDTDNLQLTASGGTSNITELVNAKKAIGRGVEAQLDLQPVRNFTLSGNASYNFTEIQDPNLEVTACGDGCQLLNPIDPATGNARINGNPLPMAPRFILNGNARYAIPLHADDEIFFSTGWSWRSGTDFGLYRATEFDGKPLLLGGMAVGYKNYARHYQIEAFVRNILDRIVTIGDIDFDNLEGYINDPRMVGVQGHVAF